MVLLDTTVWIDFLRNKQVARDYIDHLGDAAGLSVMVIAELMAGARKRQEYDYIKRMPDLFDVYGIDLETGMLGGEYFMKYAPSHGCGIFDCMIAATAKIHGLTLVTQNVKHFPMFPDLEKPF